MGPRCLLFHEPFWLLRSSDKNRCPQELSLANIRLGNNMERAFYAVTLQLSNCFHSEAIWLHLCQPLGSQQRWTFICEPWLFLYAPHYCYSCCFVLSAVILFCSLLSAVKTLRDPHAFWGPPYSSPVLALQWRTHCLLPLQNPEHGKSLCCTLQPHS